MGQHFLVNKDKLREIADVLDLKFGETVIEIGPGHGELTDKLRSVNHELKIIAIEKDKNLAESLKEKFAADKNIEIIEGDALKILPSLIADRQLQITNYKIVGNIPYYITGHLLRVIGELENKPFLVVLTIQKEVAERICSKPKKMNSVKNKTLKMSDGRFRQPIFSNGMNLLAASVQFWAEPEIVGYISKKDFQPAPEVDSAVIRLKVKNEKWKAESEKYYEFIKILFKQPRKTILNNLKPKIKNLKPEDLKLIIQKIESIGVNYQDRPQNLSVEKIKKLIELL